jgi:filamin
MSGEEPAWVRIQKKTFTRWCNNYLTQRSLGINDLQADLADGVLLHNLLEILGNEDVLPRANKKAKLKLQKVENLNSCLRYIKSKNINLVNIGAEDIYDGKIKLILGLIWTLILRFQIMAEDEESAGARAALLEWCNSVLNPQGLYVKNFTHDWQDGRSFCGLVNAIEPNNIPLNTVPASEAEKNMNRAFTSAEQLFGFPQVLDAIDVIENPDDLSIMTYVSYFRAYMLANNAYGPNCVAEGPGLTEATTFEKAPFTITTYNEEGERVERGGAMVKAFLKDEAGAEVTKVNITDNRNGTYSAFYVAERPGRFTLEVIVKKDNIKNSPFHPNVKPGEPFPGNCEAHGPGISNATAGVEVGFTVVTKDISGNVIPRGGANVSAVLHDPKGDIKVNIKDNNDGTYSATYTPKSAGTSRLDVIVATQHNGTGHIKNSPFSVNIVPGKADPNNFEWEGLELDADGRRVVVAGTTDQFKVIAKDANGNRLTAGGLNVNGKISNGPAPVDVKVQDHNDGSYGLSYSPVKVGDYQFLVSLDATPIGGKKNPFIVRCIPAEVSPPHSTAAGESLKHGVAGKENGFDVQAKDRFENLLVKGGDTLKVDLVNDEDGSAIQGEVKDNGDGTYHGSYAKATKAGKYTLTPTINGKPIKDAPFHVTISAGEPSGEHFTIEGLDLDADGNQVVVAGVTEKFTVVSRDQFGNKTGRSGLNVAGKISSGPAEVKVETHDNKDGSYALSYTPIKTGKYSFQVNYENKPIGGGRNPFGLVTIPADPHGPTSPASGSGLTKGVAGEPNSFDIKARDKFENDQIRGGAPVSGTLTHAETGEVVPLDVQDNGDGTYKGSYAGVKRAGTYKLEPKVGELLIKDAPFTVTVSEGDVDLSRFVWEGLELDGEGRNVVVAGHTESFTVIARDRFDNRITKGGLAIKGVVSNGPADVKVTVTDNNDGSYKLEYTPTKAGNYQLAVSLQDKLIGGSKNPFPLLCIPAEPHGPTSVASGDGTKKGVAGQDNGFDLQVKDKFENPLTQGGADVAATLTGPNGQVVQAKAVDNGDGTYRLTYPDVTSAGTYKLLPTVTGAPVKDAPFTVTITESGADPKNFVWEGPAFDVNGANVVVAGNTEHFTVIAHDKFKNRLTSGGLNVHGTIKGSVDVKVGTTDHQNGAYKLEYTPTKAEKYEVTVSLDQTPIGGSVNPFTLQVIPAEAHGPSSIASGDGLTEAVAGEANTFYIGSHDKYENECVKGGAAVAATLKHQQTGAAVQGEVEDEGDGTYEVSYPTITKAGTYSLVPTIKSEPVKGAPFTVTVREAAADAAHFKWHDVNDKLVAGQTESFTVVAHDRFDNRVTTGGLEINAHVKGVEDVKADVHDNQDGSYKVTYTPKKVGDYQVSVDLAKTLLGGHANPFGIKVSPAGAGGRSVASGPGLKNAEVGGDQNKFSVEARDDFDNKLTKGGDKVAAELVNDATGEKVPVAVKDNGDGTYSAEYPGITKAGNYTLTPTVNGQAVVDAPFKVKVNPGGFDPNNTGVEIPNPGHAGRKGPKVSVKDKQGNLRAGFDDDVEADLTPKMKIPKIKAKSNGDGTYEIDYPANLLPGAYEIDIRVNNSNVPNAPFNSQVELKELTPEHSQALDETVPENKALFQRLLLNATEAERDAVVKALKALKQ